MAKLTKKQLGILNNFLKENGLIKRTNNELDAHGLIDFEVVFIKIRPKAISLIADNPTKCLPTEKEVEICRPSGICETICVPKDELGN